MEGSSSTGLGWTGETCAGNYLVLRSFRHGLFLGPKALEFGHQAGKLGSCTKSLCLLTRLPTLIER